MLLDAPRYDKMIKVMMLLKCALSQYNFWQLFKYELVLKIAGVCFDVLCQSKHLSAGLKLKPDRYTENSMSDLTGMSVTAINDR